MRQTLSDCSLFSLKNLEGLTNSDQLMISEFNQVFIQNVIRRDLPGFIQAYKERDMERLRWFIHKMRPSIDLYDVSSIVEVAIELEQLAAAGKWREDIHGLVETVSTTIQRLGHAIIAYEQSNLRC